MNIVKKAGLVGVLAGATTLNGCILNPNDYPGQEEQVRAYNRRQLVGGFLFAAAPFARNIPQAAGMNAAAHLVTANNIVASQGLGQAPAQEYRTPTWDAFSCTQMLDTNHNGYIDQNEIIDKNKTLFEVGQPYTQVLFFSNLAGKTIKFIGQDYPDGELKERGAWFIPGNIPSGSLTVTGTANKPGRLEGYWTIDDIKISDATISMFN